MIATRTSQGRVSSTEAVRLRGAPFGLEPLYAQVQNGELFVARRASDLVDARAPIFVERLCALLTSSAPLTPEASVFDGVIRIPPDTTTSVFRDRVSVEPVRRLLHERTIAPIDAADEQWRLIVASVKNSIADSKHVAVATGGGVDSSGILAAALAVCRGANRIEAEAVALHFAGDGDDRPYLHDLERELGIVAIKVAPADGGSAVMPLLTSPTMPSWSWSASGDFSIFRAARSRGADVVLTGFGGDDLFDGNPRALAGELVRGRLGSALRAARLEPSDASSLHRVGNWILRPIAASMIPNQVLSARRFRALSAERPWIGPAFRQFLEKQKENWRPTPLNSPAARFDALAKATYLADAVEMNEEIAVRADMRVAHPYLDTALVRFVASLPPTLLLHADRLRGLFRLAIRGAVPTRVRLRTTKAAFINSWREALNAAGGLEILRDLATMRECTKIGLVEPSAVQAELVGLEQDPMKWTLLWPFLGVEGFLRARMERG